jgi:hypothetical protein
MKLAATVVGLLLVLVGTVWFLQGIGVLPGSFMSGQTRWAVNGGIAFVVGAALLVGVRRTPGSGDR